MPTLQRAANPLRVALQEFGRLDGHAWPVADATAGPAGPSVVAADTLLHSDAAISRVVAGSTRLLSVDDPDESASVVAAHWAWLLTMPARAAWTLARVVPDVHPTNVRFVTGPTGVPEVMFFASDRYACLAGSPASSCAEALVFATTQTLNAWWLGRVLDAHLEPLMTTLHRITGTNRSRLQQSVAAGFAAARDAVANTLCLCTLT